MKVAFWQALRFLVVFLSIFAFFNLKVYQVFSQEDRYEKELKRLEEELEALKTRVLETKKAIKVFSDMLLYGTLTGTKVMIYLKSTVPAKISAISVKLDGFEVKRIENFSPNAGQPELLYEESELIPGTHTLDITIEFEGKRRFRKISRYVFVVEKGIGLKIFAQVKPSPIAKGISGPDDIDITWTTEKVRLISK